MFNERRLIVVSDDVIGRLEVNSGTLWYPDPNLMANFARQQADVSAVRAYMLDQMPPENGNLADLRAHQGLGKSHFSISTTFSDVNRNRPPVVMEIQYAFDPTLLLSHSGMKDQLAWNSLSVEKERCVCFGIEKGAPYIHYMLAVGGPFALDDNKTRSYVFASNDRDPFPKDGVMTAQAQKCICMWCPGKGLVPIIISEPLPVSCKPTQQVIRASRLES